MSQRRFWKIDGFAQVPCGGTHVKSTGEVGFIELKREHPGKSIERIEIRLKENRNYVQATQEDIEEIDQRLGKLNQSMLNFGGESENFFS